MSETTQVESPKSSFDNMMECLAEIERLKAENAILREGMKGDYDLDAWLAWVNEVETARVNRQYSQGVMDDGAAILCDGLPISVDEIVRRLNAGTAK